MIKRNFFGFNLDTLSTRANTHGYDDHIKMAINSCLKYTNLETYFMYVGEKNEIYDWLVSKNVNLIDVSERPLLNRLEEAEAMTVLHSSGAQKLKIAKGTWLRVEVPHICEELGITDEHVLYTDVDVVFTEKFGDPVVNDITDTGIDKFACCHEAGELSHYNAGVMVMNTQYLRDTYDEFLKFVIDNGFDFISFDQGALNAFYKPDTITILDYREWNLPAYMPSPIEDARLIHFHGPKIREIRSYLNGEVSYKPRNEFIRVFLERVPRSRWEAMVAMCDELTKDALLS